ncbi:type II toxin-antitoxin system VapC family toxin [Fibrella aestuarina]|uniref:type II toxin-antitoxin system VapC family toxin n=1 Tax=Fibrella aestuarina TaxID=651143 RepID=UPI00030D59B2|nr:type II toxin-antitoxin system VapC family toxin [Fibrella aestuarina]
MADRIALLDSSVLIDYFRKTRKETSFFATLADQYDTFAVSVITQFEVYVGSKSAHYPFWDSLFAMFTIVPLDSSIINEALRINEQLKRGNRQIAFPDLLIAATAQAYNVPMATLNVKHFDRVAGLTLIHA